VTRRRSVRGFNVLVVKDHSVGETSKFT